MEVWSMLRKPSRTFLIRKVLMSRNWEGCLKEPLAYLGVGCLQWRGKVFVVTVHTFDIIFNEGPPWPAWSPPRSPTSSFWSNSNRVWFLHNFSLAISISQHFNMSIFFLNSNKHPSLLSCFSKRYCLLFVSLTNGKMCLGSNEKKKIFRTFLVPEWTSINPTKLQIGDPQKRKQDCHQLPLWREITSCRKEFYLELWW